MLNTTTWKPLYKTGAIAALLVAFLFSFWRLQVSRGEEYALLAENNRLRKIPIPPTRGVVFDRNSRVVASTRPSLDLVLRREGMVDAEGQMRRLERVLGVPYADLRARLDAMRGRPTFEPLVIKEDVGLADLAKIESRREWFPSVEVEESSRRDYPDGRAVAHAVGYVGEVTAAQLASEGADGGLEMGDIVGKAGIERAHDDVLRGRRGWKLVTVNSLGRQFGEPQIGRSPEDGRGLRLTIDLQLQRALLQAFGEEAGAAVFLDPWTGEILAIASMPAYDPNVFASQVTPSVWLGLLQDPARPLHDRAIGSYYAPGSTFKVLMSIAGLESGAIGPSTVLHCGGSINMYGRPLACWKKGGHGSVGCIEAIEQSCDVFFYQVGLRLGVDRFAGQAGQFERDFGRLRIALLKRAGRTEEALAPAFGADGTLALDFPTEPSDSRRRYTLEVTITDESGLPTSSRGSIEVNPDEFYIGARPDLWVGRSGEQLEVRIGALELRGQLGEPIRAGRAKTARVFPCGRPLLMHRHDQPIDGRGLLQAFVPHAMVGKLPAQTLHLTTKIHLHSLLLSEYRARISVTVPDYPWSRASGLRTPRLP